jgi:hypothetical protein
MLTILVGSSVETDVDLFGSRVVENRNRHAR